MPLINGHALPFFFQLAKVKLNRPTLGRILTTDFGFLMKDLVKVRSWMFPEEKLRRAPV
jgi:hypothetical protein